MDEFEIHSVDRMRDASRTAVQPLLDRFGFVPNVAAMMAQSPTLVGVFVQTQLALRGTTLSDVQREIVALTVSHHNQAAYSMALHSAFAREHGAAPEVVDAARDGEPLPDRKLEALRQFTITLLTRRGPIGTPDTDALCRAGYTAEQVFEVIAQAAYTSMANWVANLGQPPVDEPFRDQLWKPAG